MRNTDRAYRRALFIRFGGLGDILLATPSIRAVRRAFPGIEIDFIVGGGMGDALSGNPDVRHVYVFDKRGIDSRLDHFLPFLGRLARPRYDLVINLHPSAKSFLMAAATGARTRLTFRKCMGVQPETGRVVHAVDDFTKELRPLGIEAVSDRKLDFFVPDTARQSVEMALLEVGVRSDDHLLVINPAASRPLNRWPLERFQEIAACFASRPGVKVVLTGAPPSFRTVMDGLDEVTLADTVAAADPRILNLAGRLSVKEFGALLQRADALLTCDTGPMHIGAALETPLVVLSGAADPDRTGPLTANSTVLIDRSLACVPCRDRICARGDVLCMQNLSVPAVVDAVERRLLPESRRRIPLAFASSSGTTVRHD
jgi:ADP-heptose:LPS heptosyltransferase